MNRHFNVADRTVEISPGVYTVETVDRAPKRQPKTPPTIPDDFRKAADHLHLRILKPGQPKHGHAYAKCRFPDGSTHSVQMHGDYALCVERIKIILHGGPGG
jgi:hypothetical protein